MQRDDPAFALPAAALALERRPMFFAHGLFGWLHHPTPPTPGPGTGQAPVPGLGQAPVPGLGQGCKIAATALREPP